MSVQYFRFSCRAGSEPSRSPLLEKLLARAEACIADRDWRADAFRIIAPHADGMPAVAPAAIFADLGAVAGGWICIAAPVRYVAEMSNVRFAPDGILSLSRPDAEGLVRDFNRVWLNSGVRLIAGRLGGLYCIFDRPLEAATSDPQDVLDRHIEAYLPAGPDSPCLRRLMSEIEMWLFEHAVNAGRTAQGLPALSGLWLWGGGAPVAHLPKVSGFCAGDDVFFNALGGLQSDTGVVVVPDVPGTDGWRQAEARWLEPAFEHLRSRRIARLDLSAGDRRYSLSARASRRFWRRARPWWECFA